MALAALGLAGLTAPLALAATQTLTVTTFSDPATSVACPATAGNPCSLREAITVANGDTGDTISLPAGSYTMAQGVLPSITASMSFVGASAPSTVINGTTGDLGPLFSISGEDLTVDFSNLTIQDADDTADNSGAVYVGPSNTVNVTDVAFINNQGIASGAWDGQEGSTTTMTDVTFSGNEDTSAGDAAAVLNAGILALTNVTIADNVGEPGSGAVGGILNEGTLSITNSDIVGNIGDGPAGGVWFEAGTADVVNSIISGNTQDDASTNDNCQGTVTTTSYNIEDGATCGFTGTGDLDANPDLGALAYNGGPLETEALLTGSPAINAGLNSSCPTDDERGYVRITASDPICDIGAYEYGAGPVTTPTPTPTATPTPTPTPSGVPVPATGAVGAGTSSGSLWALLLLIAGLGLAVAALRSRGRDPAV
jgi:CSLREA domain-containing protein